MLLAMRWFESLKTSCYNWKCFFINQNLKWFLFLSDKYLIDYSSNPVSHSFSSPTSYLSSTPELNCFLFSLLSACFFKLCFTDLYNFFSSFLCSFYFHLLFLKNEQLELLQYIFFFIEIFIKYITSSFSSYSPSV